MVSLNPVFLELSSPRWGVRSHAAPPPALEAPGGEQWVLIVRQARHLAVGHDDCVHVISDVPGHVTPKPQRGFSVLSKLFSVHRFLGWGRNFIWSCCAALVFPSKLILMSLETVNSAA